MFWAAALLTAAWAFHYLVTRRYRTKQVFWTLVRQYPDLAQAWFEQNDCWQIFLNEPAGGYRVIVPEAIFAGPFGIFVRDKATGTQKRAAVFCAHRELAASQEHFPHFIASVIGQYPKPKRIPMNWLLGMLATAATAIWLFSPGDLDRWVIRDGTVACPDEAVTKIIQGASTASYRRTRTERAVTDDECIVLFANERVRVLELSVDGSRALARTTKKAVPLWMISSDLRKTNPGWLTVPWWPNARSNAKDPEAIAAVSPVPPLLNSDGTCKDWSHALRHGYLTECREREGRINPPRPDDPTPQLGEHGRCTNWPHALKHRYMDTCFAALEAANGAKREGGAGTTKRTTDNKDLDFDALLDQAGEADRAESFGFPTAEPSQEARDAFSLRGAERGPKK